MPLLSRVVVVPILYWYDEQERHVAEQSILGYSLEAVLQIAIDQRINWSGAV